ncbi:MAG: VOC family protein [Paracoccaceae bacterium]|jgi:catechol 2,3-dioxygenase-like lactoylglutathione lyase family enzyme
MNDFQTQGVHHITLNGADRQTSIDFWQGILGMPLVFEQPNLDALHINHLYFDCGGGSTITVFTDEAREAPDAPLPQPEGSLHHLALWVDKPTLLDAVSDLNDAGIASTGIKDREFMDSLYFRDPLGLLVELAAYKFEPPEGVTHAQVLGRAHKIRIARDAMAIEEQDVVAAVLELTP